MRSKEDVQSRLDFAFLEIKDRKYIWLPDILLFFESTPFFDEFFPKYKRYSTGELHGFYTDTDKENMVNQTLDDIANLIKQAENYRKQIDSWCTSTLPLNSIEINIAHGCNLRCAYCLAGDGSHGKSKFMTEAEAKVAIDFLLTNSKDSKNLYIAIIGGEPLLNMPVFKYILQYASECSSKSGKQIYFTTTVNGTLLTPEIVDTLDQYQVRTMLSLDSHIPEIHDKLRPAANGNGSYEGIMKNGWNSLLANPDHRGIRMTVTPENLHFFETVKTFFEAGFYHVHIDEVVSEQQRFQFSPEEIALLKKEYEKLADYLIDRIAQGDHLSCHPLMTDLLNIDQQRPKINHCGALKHSLGISSELGVYPCDTMLWEKYKVGSLQDGIDPAEILEKVNQSRQMHCTMCWARNVCGQGCLLKHFEAATERKGMDCELALHKFMLEIYIYAELKTRRPDYFGQV